MNRRRYIVGLACLATGATVTVGSGAFTSLEADRDLDVEVADDSNALFTLFAVYYHYVDDENGEFSIDLSGDAAEFNDRAFVNFEDLVENTNEGHDDVYVAIKIEGPSPPGVSNSVPIFRHHEAAPIAGTEPYELGQGESEKFVLFFNMGIQDNLSDVIDDLNKITILAGTDEYWD